jgi:hypothetical protein
MRPKAIGGLKPKSCAKKILKAARAFTKGNLKAANSQINCFQ